MSNRRISFLLVLSICFLLGMATKAEVENAEKEAEGKETIVDSTNAIVGDNEIIPLENWERDKEIDKEVYKIANELEKWCERTKGDYEAIGWNLTAVRLIKKLDELGKDALPASYEIAKDRNRNELLRILMIEGLGASREPAVTSPLVNFLMDKSESERIRVNVADWLGRIKDTTATTALIGTMEDKSNPSEIRATAAWAIFSIRDKRAIAPLLEIVQTESDEKVRRAAIAALGSNAYAFKDTSVTPIIIKVVSEEKSSSVRMMGFECLGTIGSLGDNRAVSALVDVLKTEGPNYYIIKALGISKSYKAKQVLKELLSHKDESVRFEAVKALLVTEDKSVIPEVEKSVSEFKNEGFKRVISNSLEELKKSND